MGRNCHTLFLLPETEMSDRRTSKRGLGRLQDDSVRQANEELSKTGQFSVSNYDCINYWEWQVSEKADLEVIFLAKPLRRDHRPTQRGLPLQ